MAYVKEVLLDVRTAQEFAAGHADGAINIPVQELPFRLHELAGSQKIVVYCRSGARSALATKVLKTAGFVVEDCATLEGARARQAKLVG